MSRVAKTVVAKSVLKRPQSTRKLARKMNGRQHPASKPAERRYLRQWLLLKPLKLRIQSKLTAAHKQKRLDFAKVRINLSIHHWRRVLFNNESSFGLFHTVTLLVTLPTTGTIVFGLLTVQKCPCRRGLRPGKGPHRPEKGPVRTGMGPFRPGKSPLRPGMVPLMPRKSPHMSGKDPLRTRNWERPSQARNGP